MNTPMHILEHEEIRFAYPFLLAVLHSLPRPHPELSGEIDVYAAMEEWRSAHTPENIQTHTIVPSITLPSFTLPQFPYRRAFALTGNLLIVISVTGIILFASPLIAMELRTMVYRATRSFVPIAETPTFEEVAAPVPSPTPTPIPTPPPKEQQFHITIPSIGVDSDIVAMWMQTSKKSMKKQLKTGVAHAKGTALPGEDGGHTKTIFIFAHSTNGTWNITRYNALFYALKDMEVGDTIDIVFWGKTFTYRTIEKRITEADDVAFLEPQLDKETLILQTCWPPGTSIKRLLIFAEPI